MTVIRKSAVIDSGTHGDKDRLYKRYKKAVQNTTKFNLGFTTKKTKTPANGYQAEFYRKDNGTLLQEWFLLSDKNGWTFGYVTYKEEEA